MKEKCECYHIFICCKFDDSISPCGFLLYFCDPCKASSSVTRAMYKFILFHENFWNDWNFLFWRSIEIGFKTKFTTVKLTPDPTCLLRIRVDYIDCFSSYKLIAVVNLAHFQPKLSNSFVNVLCLWAVQAWELLKLGSNWAVSLGPSTQTYFLLDSYMGKGWTKIFL